MSSRRWPTLLAWVVIAACAGLMIVGGLRRAPAVPAGTAGPHVNVDLLIQGRLAVGVHHLAGGASAANSPAGPILESLDQTTRDNAVERLRTVPVVAETAGVEAAVARLDELEKRELAEALRADVAAFRICYTPRRGALDAQAQQRLVAHHGWFARLALTHGMADSLPERRAVLAPAIRAAITVTVGLMLAGVALLLGVILLVLALVRYLDGRLRFAYVPPPPGRDGPFVEAFAIFLLEMIFISIVLASVLETRSLAINFALAAAVPLAVVWPRLRGLSWAEVRAGFGWHRGRGLLREAGWGIVGYIAGLPLLFVAVIVTSLLARVSGTTPTHPIVEQAAGAGPPDILLLYLLAAVYAPLVEETMFRGALYHHVRRHFPWWLAAVVVGLLFAAIHPQGWVGIPMLATIALVLAALREWRGSIVAPVVAHACVNAVTVTMLVLMTG